MCCLGKRGLLPLYHLCFEYLAPRLLATLLMLFIRKWTFFLFYSWFVTCFLRLVIIPFLKLQGT